MTEETPAAIIPSLTFYIQVVGRNEAFAMNEKSNISLKMLQSRILTIHKRVFTSELQRPLAISKRVQPPLSSKPLFNFLRLKNIVLIFIGQ